MNDQAPQTSGFDTPSAYQPPAPTAPSGLTDQDRQEIGRMVGWLASAAKPQAAPVPAAPPQPSYFQRFDGVSVGEKLATATGYGVIAVGTFAGCCGVAKLMGVVK
jgi:hypothetical protein